MVTPIKTKQETFRLRFEREHKDGGRYVASEGQTGHYVASGSKPRRVLLVFVVKSQRKLRLRRNKKRFDENSNENAKEDLSEALKITGIFREGYVNLAFLRLTKLDGVNFGSHNYGYKTKFSSGNQTVGSVKRRTWIHEHDMRCHIA
ncbi:hypothetical protein DY000_02055258 [Brassica cretica]|uniref:Uncharacterized protein n=1 Tax=Brassica cretica TaxID=69181 RepID=A0ABQ7A4Z8_BRACR|nr:hypothetical protein DY000_02055258 [Brassica cretica]